MKAYFRFTVVLGFCLSLVVAAMPNEAFAMDLLEAYDLALVNDELLNAAKSKADAGREALPQARAKMLPNVSFSSSDSFVEQQRITSNAAFPTQRFPSTSHTVTIKQPIIRMDLVAGYFEARANVKNAESVLDYSYQDLSSRVAQAYFEVLLSTERLNLIRVQKDSYLKQYKSASALFESGFGSRTDADAFRANYDQTYAKEIELKQLIEYNQQQLSFYVGAVPYTVNALNIEVFKPDQFQVGNYQDWLNRALEHNPELVGLKSKVDSLSAKIYGAKAGHLPTVDALAQYSNNSSQNVYFAGTELDSKSIGVQINVPIYSGGGISSSVREAQALHQEARYQYLDALNNVALHVKKNYDALKQGVVEIQALERAVSSFEQLVKSNKMGVEAGTRTVMDVLTAEQQKVDSQVSLAEARLSFLQSWIDLHAILGDVNRELIAELNRNFKL